MKRAPALKLLRAHAAKNLDAHEASMAADMIRFVENHENCAERGLPVGHLTGSAWIVDAARRRTLLTHHRKLDKWLQLGGHADGEMDLASVAMREAREESGADEAAFCPRHNRRGGDFRRGPASHCDIFLQES